MIKQFFFKPERPHFLALIRISLGFVFLGYFLNRFPYIVELYSNAGVPMPLFPGSNYSPQPISPLGTSVLYAGVLFSLLAITIGWQTRMSLWIGLVLTTWIGLLDYTGTFKKYSVVTMHAFFILSLSDCGAIWSVDHFLKRKQQQSVRLVSVWPRRLMQFLLINIYWGAAVTKIRLPDFAVGDLLMFNLLDHHWGCQPLGLWVTQYPNLVALASISTILFEFTIPVLIWISHFRRISLLLAIFFHVSIGLTMSVSIFSPVMICILLAFLKESDLYLLNRLFSFVGRLIKRYQIDEEQPSTPKKKSSSSNKSAQVSATWKSFLSRKSAPLLCYFFSAGIVITTVVSLQHYLDWYGVFREQKVHEFQFLESDQIDEMLVEQLPAYEDYIHRIQIGSRFANFHVFGSDDQFKPGMTVYALARMVQGHPAFEFTWELIAPDGQVTGSLNRILISAHPYAYVEFPLHKSLPEGRYRILLHVNNHLVASIPFEFINPEYQLENDSEK